MSKHAENISIFGLVFVVVSALSLPLAVKVLLAATAVSVMETLKNKMRLFKVRVYLAAAGILLLLAIVAQ